MLTNEFAARPALIRHAIDQHAEWIEKSLGLPLSQAVIVGCDISFMDAAIPQLLGRVVCRDSREEPVRVLTALLESVEIPPLCAPMLQADPTGRTVDLQDAHDGVESRQSYSLKWDDGPIAFHIRGVPSPVIAFSVSYHAGTSTPCENVAQVLIFRRDASEQVLKLLERLGKPNGEPKLHMLNSLPQRILPCDWISSCSIQVSRPC